MSTIPSSLRTNIECIDDEHAWLLARLSLHLRDYDCGGQIASCGMCDSATQKLCDRKVTAMLTHLSSYASMHFQHEEELMDCLPADQAELHKREHADILRQITSLALGTSAQPLIAHPADVEKIIRAWLEDHIMRFDMPLAMHLGAGAK
jgi:hemerythrin-like metal-binding protein